MEGKKTRVGKEEGEKVLVTGLAFSSRSFVMSLGYFDFEFAGSNFFHSPYFFFQPSFEPSNGNIMMIYETL